MNIALSLLPDITKKPIKGIKETEQQLHVDITAIPTVISAPLHPGGRGGKSLVQGVSHIEFFLSAWKLTLPDELCQY